MHHLNSPSSVPEEVIMPGLLPDWRIKESGMVMPCEENIDRPGIISYGLSSYGYDIRVGNRFKVFTNVYGTGVVDPKGINGNAFIDREIDICVIPPNSFVLAETVEEFKIPRDILCLCVGKSTYARCGLIVNVTPLEPEWCGKLTLEISNTTPLPAKVYANEGVAQLLFFRASEICRTSYADKKGKYQNQAGLTLPIVKR